MRNQKIDREIQRGRRSAAQTRRIFQRTLRLQAEALLRDGPRYEQVYTDCRRLARTLHVARLRLSKAHLNRKRLLRDLAAAEQRIACSELAEREGMAAQARVLEELELLKQAARERAATELAAAFSASLHGLDNAPEALVAR